MDYIYFQLDFKLTSKSANWKCKVSNFYAILNGEGFICLIALGTIAVFKLCLGEDMNQLETYCVEEASEFANWDSDVRGGSVLSAVKYATTYPGVTSPVLVAQPFDSQEH